MGNKNSKSQNLSPEINGQIKPQGLIFYDSNILNAQIDELIIKWPSSHISVLTQKFKEVSTHTFGSFSSMSITGFARLLEKFANTFPKEIIENCFNVFNEDGTGRMNFREFLRIISICELGDENMKNHLLFQFFHTNKSQNNYLTKKELLNFFLYASNYFKIPLSIPTALKNRETFIFIKNEEKRILKQLKTDYNISFPLSEDDFKLWIQKFFNINDFFEDFFEMIPNAYKEKKLIKTVIEQSCNENFSIKKVDKYYILSFQWWELWKVYVNMVVERGFTINRVQSKEKIYNEKQEEDKEKQLLKPLFEVISPKDKENLVNQSFHLIDIDEQIQNVKQNIYDTPKGKENKLNLNPQSSSNFIEDKDNYRLASNSSIPVEINKYDANQKKKYFKPDEENPDDSYSVNSLRVDSYSPILLRKIVSSDSNLIEKNDRKIGSETYIIENSEKKINAHSISFDPNQKGFAPIKEEKNEIDHEFFMGKKKGKDVNPKLYEVLKFNMVVRDIGDRPDPISNYELEGEYPGVLKQNILLNQDYVLVPKNAWSQLVSWYGGGPTFKRNSFPDERRGITIVDLYPIYFICYRLRSNLDIDYESKQTILIGSMKDFAYAKKKISKKFKIEHPDRFIIYFKIQGTQWTRGNIVKLIIFYFLVKSLNEKMKETHLKDGSIILLVNIDYEQKFMERYIYKEHEEDEKIDKKDNGRHSKKSISKKKPMIEEKKDESDSDSDEDDESENNQEAQDNKKSNQKNEEVFNLDLGDFADVFNPETFVWKVGVLLEIKDESLKFHFPNESYLNDIWINYKQIEELVTIPFTASVSKNENLKVQKISKKYLYLTSKNKMFINSFYPGISLFSNERNNNYINAIVYILCHTPGLAEYFANLDYENDLKKNQYNLSLFSADNYIRYTNTVSEEFYSVLKNIYTKPNDSQIIMHDLLIQIKLHMPKFSGYERGDAAEFLIEMLNIFSEELSKKKRIRKIIRHTEINIKNQESQSALRSATVTAKLKNSTNPMAGKDMEDIYESFNEIDSIVRKTYLGKLRKHVVCKKCGKNDIDFEHFVMIPLPIPKITNKYFEIYLIKKPRTGYIPPIIKYGVKVNRDATVKEFIAAFENISGMSSDKFQLASIYQYKVEKIFRNIHEQPIRKAGLRESNVLYAFEIFNNFHILFEGLQRVTAHLKDKEKKPFNVEDLKKDDFVDVIAKNLPTREWKYGLINDIIESEDANGNKELYFEIIYKDSRLRSHRMFNEWYPAKSNEIAEFRTKNLREDSVYLWQGIFRRYNGENHSMEHFGIPFIFAIPHCTTLKELHLKIYEQVKRHLDFKYIAATKIAEKEHLDNSQNSIKKSNILSKGVSISNLKKSTSPQKKEISHANIFLDPNKNLSDNPAIDLRIKSLKSMNEGEYNPLLIELMEKYKNGKIYSLDELPYKIGLIDVHTERCLKCHKKIVSNVIVEKGQIKEFKNLSKTKDEIYCVGETYPMEDKPVIFYVADPNHVLICIDWLDIGTFNKDSLEPTVDSSVFANRKEKKLFKKGNDLQYCLSKILEQPNGLHFCRFCKDYRHAAIRTSFWKLPDILVLQLNRFKLSRNKYVLKNPVPIEFPVDSLNLEPYVSNKSRFINKSNMEYELFAICNHTKYGPKSYYTANVLIENNDVRENENQTKPADEGLINNDENKLINEFISKKNNWTILDIDKIGLLKEQKFLVSRKAYLLFYRKKGLECKVNADLITEAMERKEEEREKWEEIINK